MSTAFTDTERAILRIVQFQLPDTLTPYADIAREAVSYTHLDVYKRQPLVLRPIPDRLSIRFFSL